MDMDVTQTYYNHCICALLIGQNHSRQSRGYNAERRSFIEQWQQIAYPTEETLTQLIPRKSLLP
jgi:hypothetical protein